MAKHYGIDTGAKAFDYIIGHNLKDPDLKTTMLDAGTRINKAYKEIITIVDKHIKDKKRWVLTVTIAHSVKATVQNS